MALLALLAYRFARSRPALKRRRLLTDARNRFLRDAATARLSS